MINMSVSSLAIIVKNTNGSDGAQSKTMNALRGVNMEVGVDGDMTMLMSPTGLSIGLFLWKLAVKAIWKFLEI
ncbi:hypothetical protein Tco_1390483, partial [Tanacetum coccineum]